MTTSENNGKVPSEREGPPWMSVPADAMVDRLTGQLAAQAQQIAAMSIYIDQLHQALAATADEKEAVSGRQA